MKHPCEEQLAEQLASLCEPVRLRVLALLEAEELSVGEVARVVQLPQSTVSRHLKVLAEAGWTSRRPVGTATLYSLEPGALDEGTADLWQAVRKTLDGSPQIEEDRVRLAAVVADRPTDSRAFFGRIGGEWDELRRGLFGDRFTCEAMLSLIPPTWTVADLGCGTGDAAAWLATRVERVIAVDQSGAMLKAARTRLAGVAGVEFVEGPLEGLPLAPRSVDAAVCLLVLHHLEDPAGAIREMARIVRSDRGGGVALVVDMIEHQRQEYRHTMGHRHLGFAPELVGAWMREAGFARVETRALAREPDGKGPGLFAAAGWAGGPG
ncbi:MAG: metalloregulator ArsR/SmtB family transcription factor [Phycisphaerales bacterium]|nr:metalloregulator ArsR/SmtB family transcription factor [Phycisphaerales bacterium]